MKRIWTSLAIVIMLSAQPVLSQDKPDDASRAKATFAGGCFWCMEGPFDKLEGVISTTSGYIGGHKKDPTYHEVTAGGTGHAEAVQVVYDPQKVTYQKLLDVFWVNIDPTVKDRQFCDVGSQYRSAIFYHNDEQKRLAEASKQQLEKNKPFEGMIYTEVTAATEFYPAEDYHQDYYSKNPIRYKFYRYGCGRDKRLKDLWGGPASMSNQREPHPEHDSAVSPPSKGGILSKALQLFRMIWPFG